MEPIEQTWTWTWTAADWSAVAAWVAVLVTTVAVGIALVQLHSFVRDGAERARPFVIADLVFSGYMLQFQLWNSSPTLAANVRVVSDKPLRSSWADGNAGLRELLDGRVISQLAPGRRIEWAFDNAPQAFEVDPLETYRVTVTYDDPRQLRRRGVRFWRSAKPVTYVDTFDLSIRHFNEAAVERDPAAKIVSAIDKLEHAVGRLNGTLGSSSSLRSPGPRGGQAVL